MSLAPASSPTVDTSVEDMIRLTERLTSLLADQAKAFEARRPQDAAATMEETSRLANAYRLESARLRMDPGPLAGLKAEDRLRLVRATEAFDAVIARHGRALTAAKTVTEGLVQAIAHEVAAQRSRGSGYGPDGSVSRRGALTSITLNQRA